MTSQGLGLIHCRTTASAAPSSQQPPGHRSTAAALVTSRCNQPAISKIFQACWVCACCCACRTSLNCLRARVPLPVRRMCESRCWHLQPAFTSRCRASGCTTLAAKIRPSPVVGARSHGLFKGVVCEREGDDGEVCIACLPIIDYAVSCAAPEPVWGPCWWDQSPKGTEKRTTLKPSRPKTGRRQPSPKPGLPGARDPSRETPGYLLTSQVLLHSTVVAGLHPERSADSGGSSPQWESGARRARPLAARCGHRWSTGSSRDIAAACKSAERHGTSRCIFTARSGCLDEMSPFQHVIVGHIWWYSSHAHSMANA